MEEIDSHSGSFHEEKGFLVVEEASDRSDAFDVKMLLNNQISGLLPLQIQYIDNQCIYRYMTGEKISLAGLLSHRKLQFKEAYQLWKDIFHSCSICGEYLLQPEHLLLYPEYIYWSAQTKSFSICYFPGREENLEVQVKRLCEFLLKVTDHQDRLGRKFIYDWYDRLMGRGFYLSELEQYLKSYRDSEGCGCRESMTGKKEAEKRSGKDPIECSLKKDFCEEADREVIKRKKEPVDEKTKRRVSEVKGVYDRRERSEESKKSCFQGAGEKTYYLKNVSKYPEALLQFSLSEGTLSVGRAPGCDMVLVGGQVSWHHARIEVEEGQVFVTDTGSAHGVFLNKKRLIKEHPVLCRAGDIIGFADITYLLCTG